LVSGLVLTTKPSVVKADTPDPKATLQAAFNAFDANQLLFLEYSISAESETILYEKVELDKKNNIKNISSEDPDSGEWTDYYTDLKEKVTYYKDGGTWYKYPTDPEDLQGIGKTLVENGVETKIVDGATYAYDGEATVFVSNSHTGADTEFDCYVFKADIPIIITDDDSEDEDDEDDGEEDDFEEEDDSAPDYATIYYYITKDTGAWVHAESKDGLIIDVDIAYPGPGEESIALSIPKEAIKNAILEDGYITPTSNGPISYKVVYKGKGKKKKAYIVVTKCASTKKATVEKSIKILGKKYPVKEIAASAFANNKKLESVVIKADITTIGKKAFYNSKKLKTITIKSKKVSKIGKNAFDTNSKKLTIKIAGKKDKVKKLIDKSRAAKAKKKTKLTVK
jgi:hypothetical protein